MRNRLAVSFWVLLLITGTISAQQPALEFIGTWKPGDAARSERLFAVGLSEVTAEGFRIAVTKDTITVTRLDADGLLAAARRIGTLNVAPMTTYTLDPRESSESIQRYVGPNGTAVVQGRRLVITTVAPHASWQTSYEIEDGALTTVSLSSSRATTVVQSYRKAGN